MGQKSQSFLKLSKCLVTSSSPTLTKLRGALTPGTPGHGATGACPLRVATFHVLLPSPEKTRQANSALKTDRRGLKGRKAEDQVEESQGSFKAALRKVICDNWTQKVGLLE